VTDESTEKKSMATGTKRNNARIREEQTEHILEAARRLFAHKGYSDTTMTEIAAAAGVSYGLAYHYFKDKGEIFTRVIEEALHSAVALMQYVRQMPGTPWEHLQWLTTRMLEGAQHQPEAFMVVMQAFANDAIPEEARESAWKSAIVSLETFKQMIIEGQKAGQVVSGDPDHLTSAFGWCIQGMALGMCFMNRKPDSAVRLPVTSYPDADDLLRMLKT
jgi:AcrR family transcriptional regulator